MPKPRKPIGGVPRPCILARASKDKESKEEWSLDEQIHECRQYARDTWHVTVPDSAVMIEDGISGLKRKLEQRPGLRDAVQGCEAGTYTHLLVPAADRYGRNLGLMAQILDRLNAAGTPIISVKDHISSESPSGNAFFQAIVMMAQWQAERTAEQVRSAQTAKRRRGLVTCPLAYGAMRDADGVAIPDRRIITVTTAAGVTQETCNHDGLVAAFTWRAEGASYRAIAKQLNDAGYRTTRQDGNLFLDESVRVILTNRFYIGELRAYGDWLPGKHEPLIPLELWQRVQAVNAQRQLHRQSVRLDAQPSAYSGGIVQCVTCLHAGRQGAFHIMHRRNERSRHETLACHHVTQGHTCDAPSINAAILHRQIEALLGKLILPEDEQRVAIDAYLDHQAQQPRQVTSPSAQIRSLEERLARQRDLYDLGDITAEEYRARRQPLLTQIDDLRASATGSLPEPQRLYDISAYLRDLSLAWRHATPAQRQHIVRLLFRDLYVEQRRLVAVRPTQAFQAIFHLCGTSQFGYITIHRKRRHSILPSSSERGRDTEDTESACGRYTEEHGKKIKKLRVIP